MTLFSYTPRQWLGVIFMCVLAVLAYSFHRSRAPFPHNTEVQRMVLSALAILLIEDHVFSTFVMDRKADGKKTDITAQFTAALQPYIRDQDRQIYHWTPQGIITDQKGNPIVIYASRHANGKLLLDVMGRDEKTRQEKLLLQLEPNEKSLTAGE